ADGESIDGDAPTSDSEPDVSDEEAAARDEQEAVTGALEIAGDVISAADVELAPAAPAEPASPGAGGGLGPAPLDRSTSEKKPAKLDPRARGDQADGRSYRSKRAARGRQHGAKRDGRSRSGRGRNGQREPARLSRSTPIREVVREGQEV